MGANTGAQQPPMSEADRNQVEVDSDPSFLHEGDASSQNPGNGEIGGSKTLLGGLAHSGLKVSEGPVPQEDRDDPVGVLKRQLQQEVPVLPKARSAPVLLLPARAVPNRRELAAQRAEQPERPEKPRPLLPIGAMTCRAGRSSVRFELEDEEGDGSTCAPKPCDSPSTANSDKRRRRRRSVTFGEADIVQFVACAN
mmetsp:Transcript_31720/g.83995  ORF Transcript_31720/g.83995 Transcript_31720/m.83995 type:complete len:196 (-) Transcript_31720:44-631(-)